MPTVDIPGKGSVDFPDGMSNEAIAESIRKSFPDLAPPPSRLATFGNGLLKGAAGFADALPNAVTNIANLGITGLQALENLATGRVDSPKTIPPDTLSGWTKMANEAGAIRHNVEPTDMPGRAADFVGQVAGGGGINPMAIGRNALEGAITPIIRDLLAAGGSAAGGATGQELTRNVNTGSESLDNLIKILATGGAGMAGGSVAAMRGTAGDRAAAAIRDITPENMALAKALEEKAAAAGTPIGGYEAIQSLTGKNPTMQTQERLAAASDKAASTYTPMIQQRPARNQAAFESAANAIEPPAAFPDTLAGKLQSTAADAITAQRKAGNIAAQPLYAATSNNPANRLPVSDWNSLTADDGVSAALRAVKADPYSGLQNAKEGSLQWVDQAQRYLQGKINSAKIDGDNFAVKQMTGAKEKLLNAADTAFPDYAKARGIVADNMQNNVVPMEQSQIGKLAGGPAQQLTFNAQANTLLPEKPMDVNANVMARTKAALDAQDPNITRQFIAQYLRGTMNEANQGLSNPNAGANFANKITANPTQAENLAAALMGSNTKPLNDLLEVFKAQGNRPEAGSQTAANLTEGASLGIGAHSPTTLFGAAKIPLDMISRYRNSGAASDLAKALSESNRGGSSIDALTALARTNGAYDPIKQQLLINLLRSVDQTKPAEAR